MKTARPISPMLKTREAAEFLGLGAGIKMSGTNQEDRLLTSKQAAAVLGIKPRTLQGWRKRSGTPRATGPSFIKAGRFIRYRLGDLQGWLREFTVQVEGSRRSAPFFRSTRIEQLGAKHPGLCEFVEKELRKRVSQPRIAAAVQERYGERVSVNIISNFYTLRIAPKMWAEEKARAETKAKED